jgi:hypothetical protein
MTCATTTDQRTNSKRTESTVTKLLAAMALLAICLLAPATSASAAPILSVNLDHQPYNDPVYGAFPVAASDQIFEYTASFANTGTALDSFAVPGGTVDCNRGNWTGTPESYQWRWVTDGAPAAGSAEPIETDGTVTGSRYTVDSSDAGKALQCVVSATNVTGTGQAYSAALPVGAGTTLPVPGNTGVPAGVAAAGNGLTCNAGTWSTPPAEYIYTWYRNGIQIGTPSAPTTSTSNVYTVTSDDVATTAAFQCSITGRSATGTTVVKGLTTARNTALPVQNPPAPVMPVAANAAAPTIKVSAPASVAFTLPAGVVPAAPEKAKGLIRFGGSDWTCDAATLACVTTAPPAAGEAYGPIRIVVDRSGSIASDLEASATLSGGGMAEPVSSNHAFTVLEARRLGVYDFMAGAFDAGGDEVTQAGAHPDEATAEFKVNLYSTSRTGRVTAEPVEDPRMIVTDLPAGFVGNPRVIPTCKSYEVDAGTCPPEAQVGTAVVDVLLVGDAGSQFMSEVAVYNIEPRKGHPAEFAFVAQTAGVVHVYPRVRTGGDYGISVDAPYSTQATLRRVKLTLWGVPSDPAHFSKRCPLGSFQCFFPGAASSAPRKAFLSNLTECKPEGPVTTLRMDSWQHPGDFVSVDSVSSPVTGCDELVFEPSFSTTPKARDAGIPSGYGFHVGVPQTDNPDILATPPLKDATVTLPEGVLLSPGAADGLVGCSDAQIALSSADPGDCPLGSKIGRVHVATPVLGPTEDDYFSGGTRYQLSGDVFVRAPQPGARRADGLYGVFLHIADDQTGVVVKLRGDVVPDPVTGRLVASFKDNPRLPFTDVLLEFKDGSRAPLSNPEVCGTKATATVLSSWGGPTGTPASSFEAGDGCVGSRSDLGFAPSLVAGSTSPGGGGWSSFETSIKRPSADQNVSKVSVDLPNGLLADVSGVDLCPAGQADVGACGAGALIGRVAIAVGPGKTPVGLPQPGKAPTKVFLSGPYKGAPYSLSAVVPAQAGPFDLGTVVARIALDVDRTDAHVSARLVESRILNQDGTVRETIASGLPQIVEGTPAMLQTINLTIDRDKFIYNPTNCTEKKVTANLGSPEGKTADLATRFQVADCAALPFEPKLALSLTGRKQITTGKHPGVKAIVTQAGIGEAGIDKAVVRLPKSLALDPANAQALCEFEAGTKPDLENHCPKGSIVGRARAKTPLLENDLVGNVYFVKNVRTDPKTGNTIRTLPMIIVALRGEIAVNLRGESSTTKAGKLVNTFANVPDAPITKFNLNINGGKNGILAVTRTRKAKINLCSGRHTAEADIDGQNGRRHDTDIRMKTPCSKKQVRKAKRAAKKAAARS